MSAEDIYKHMTPAAPKHDPRTPGQIIVDAMKEYVRLKEQVMSGAPAERRDEVRDEMQSLRGIIAPYMGIPYVPLKWHRYGKNGLEVVQDEEQ